MKRVIERIPSTQMYSYISLVERKVAEFYHNIDRRSWLVWVEMTYFHRFFRTIPGVLGTTCNVRYQTKHQRTSLQIKFSSKKRFYVSHIWCFLCKNVVWLMFYWAFCKNLLVFWIIPLPINVLWNEYDVVSDSVHKACPLC